MMDSYTNHLRHGINYLRLNNRTIQADGHATDLFADWSIVAGITPPDPATSSEGARRLGRNHDIILRLQSLPGGAVTATQENA